jgi:hypothetical protein
MNFEPPHAMTSNTNIATVADKDMTKCKGITELLVELAQ